MIDFKQVLILDDNETTIFLHQDLIEDVFPNAEVYTYTDSDTFLEDLIKNNTWFESPTLLLLDINMPDKQGYDVLEEMEEEIEDTEELSVLMVTSSNLKRDLERSKRFSNIVGYIEKPLTQVKVRQSLGEFY
tara:strand:- start:5192 stop:5587 length:396 start_codon:yes stop_codon:yes gene_type:complete